MISVLFSLQAIADPMDGNVQLAVGQSAFDFFVDYAMDIPLIFEQDTVAQPYECWESVGVENLNISAEWNDLDVKLFETYLEVEGSFSQVRGEDMLFFAEGGPWYCAPLNFTVYYVDVQNLAFSMRLAPVVNAQGMLEMSIIGAPTVTGNLDTNIGWFPDQLVLFFFEDTIWNLIEEQIAEQVPSLVREYSEILYFQGETDLLRYRLELADTYVRQDALLVGGELDLEYIDGGECVLAPEEAVGRDIELSFSEIDSADIGFGLTEYDLNSLIQPLWEDGLFCLSEESIAEAFAPLQDIIDPSIGRISLDFIVQTLPTVQMTEEGLSLSITDANIKIKSPDVADSVLDITVNISAKLSLTVDISSSSFGLSVHDVHLDIVDITAEDILADTEYAEQYLKQFVENSVATLLDEQLQTIPVYRSVIHEYGFYALGKGVSHYEGGMEVYIDIYDENDPEVDRLPPDTTVSLDEQRGDSVVLSWVGEDDRWDPLLFSYQVDDGSWSSWTEDSSVQLEDVLPGEHLFSVKARDRWWNEDPTPASLRFFVESAGNGPAESTVPSPKGCGGCAQQGDWRRSSFWILALGLVLGYRRRE